MNTKKSEEATNEATNEYTFSYYFGGRKWCTSVWASSPEEAIRKIKAQSCAVYDGEVKLKIHIPISKSWIKRISSWIKKVRKK